MKLLLDDKQLRGYDLNSNEACIFAAILKCTRSGRGWYGNYRELAAAMPFVMSHMTAHRAVEKLLNLGLLERRENKLFALYQNVTEPSQIVTTLEQNVTDLEQNVLPPNNPPIINNNMNENQLSSPAQDARTEEKKTEKGLDFMDFWFLFSAPKDKLNRENACRRLWESTTWTELSPKREILISSSITSPNPNPLSFVGMNPVTSYKSVTTEPINSVLVRQWNSSTSNGFAIGSCPLCIFRASLRETIVPIVG